MSLTGAGDIIVPITYRVDVRPAWSGAWTTVNYLYPIQSTDCVAPSIGQAVFEFRYGRSKKCDQTTISNYSPLTLRGYYVRIYDVTNAQGLWYGQFDTEELVPKGTVSSVAAGTQTLTAWGICHVLERSPIDYAVGSDASGNSLDIGWVPDINRRAESIQVSIGSKTRNRGNRSASVNAEGVYQFSDDGDEWSNLDACNMLLNNYVELGAPVFSMGGQSSVLDLLHDTIDMHSKSGTTRNVWEVLCDLVDRRRGMGFVPVVNNDDTVTLQVFTVLGTAVALTGITIPANPNTTNINVDQRIEVLDCRIITSNSVRYDKVFIRGARMLSCFTVSQADGTLQTDWVAGFKTAYDAAAGSISGYGSLSNVDQQELNDRIRKDDIYKSVYTRQRLPRSWNGQAGNGVGGSMTNVVPVCDESGAITFPSSPPYMPLDKKFEKALPFEEDVDYSGSVPAPDTEPTYRKPFACVQDETDPTHTATNGWHFCHDPGEALKEEGADADLEIHPTGTALSIKASPPHIYGLGSFNPATAALSAYDPVLKLGYTLATVAMYTDNTLLASALRSGVSSPITVKSLRLTDAEYWTVAAGTVIGLNPDGTLQRVAGQLTLRDDRARMWEACAIALAWFGQERRVVVLTLKGLSLLAPLGNLVQAVGAAGGTYEANTILSSRMLDYRNQKVTIETMFIEWDWKETKE